VTTDLETHLRDTLAAEAARLDLQSAMQRVRAVDYRPRRVRLSRRLSIGAAAGSATAGTVVAVVLLGGAQPAFAGWTATPTAATSAQAATAGDSCESSLANGPMAQQAGSASWDQVVTDVRGPFVVSTYENNGVYATCFTGPDFTAVNASADDGQFGSVSVSGEASGTPTSPTSSSVELLSGGDIERLTVEHLNSAADGPYTLIAGQVSSAVTAVTLAESDGTQVVATVANGWVIAWWPGDNDIASAAVTTASGTVNQTLTQAGPPATAPGAAVCGGGATSNSASCTGSSSAG
jgi:hypothetical protein